MKIKLGQIVIFEQFYNSVFNQKIKMKTAYKLNKLYGLLKSDIDFYKEKLSTIVNQYCERDENGMPIYVNETNIKVRPNEVDNCINEINDLEEVETEINEILFSIDEFDGVDIEPKFLNGLGCFIED